MQWEKETTNEKCDGELIGQDGIAEGLNMQWVLDPALISARCSRRSSPQVPNLEWSLFHAIPEVGKKKRCIVEVARGERGERWKEEAGKLVG